uniref:Transposase n=1 Tax=Candidatus Kentrum sp. TC TaxID=2126339 RepID=A0A450YNY9_9GAMM|nr:MAG: Transposase [Candidatus Kentron sp. TC]
MPHYDEECKEKLIREMMSSSGRSIPEIHGNTGISEATLYGWRRKYGGDGPESEETRQSNPKNWKGEEKPTVVIETEGLNKQELSENDVVFTNPPDYF